MRWAVPVRFAFTTLTSENKLPSMRVIGGKQLTHLRPALEVILCALYFPSRGLFKQNPLLARNPCLLLIASGRGRA